MKFRAVVTQYFSFTDSSQNNASPGVCRQLSWARWQLGVPAFPLLTGVPSVHCCPTSRCFRAEKAASQLVEEGLGGTEIGPPGHPSGHAGPGNAS